MNTPLPALRRRVRHAGSALWDGPAGHWLRERGQELADAAYEPAVARPWVKVAAALAAAVPVLGAAAALLHIYGDLGRSLAIEAGRTPLGRHGGDLVAVVTHPVRAYLAGHAPALPAGAGVLYAAWQLLAVALWIGSRRRSNGARAAWVLLGAATGAMVWAGSPATGQALAAGEFALAWALISIPALRGLSLRPCRHIYVDARPAAAP